MPWGPAAKVLEPRRGVFYSGRSGAGRDSGWRIKGVILRSSRRPPAWPRPGVLNPAAVRSAVFVFAVWTVLDRRPGPQTTLRTPAGLRRVEIIAMPELQRARLAGRDRPTA